MIKLLKYKALLAILWGFCVLTIRFITFFQRALKSATGFTILLVLLLMIQGVAWGQTAKLYLDNAQTQTGTGTSVYDIATATGTASSVSSESTTSTTLAERLAFTRDINNLSFSISGNSFTVSVDVSAANNCTYRFRLQRLNSSGIVQASTGYSGTFAAGTIGIQTATLSFSSVQVWASGDRLKLSIETARSGGGTNTYRSITVRTDDADSYVQYVTGTSVLNYCASYGNMSYADGVTLVLFNSINNISGKPAGYNDYGAQSTNVNIGQTYNLTVKLNTDGNYINYATAWIDWNQDGDFTGSGESFNLGITTNNANGSTSLSPLPIQIPSSATLGYTRMRVSTRYAQQPGSCDTNFDGEVEDYTINVVSACVDASLILNTSNSTQSVCTDIPISSIAYLAGGDATGASISGLPAGVSGSYNSGPHIFTISGTPTGSGVFNFTVTTTGTPSPCAEATMDGTITVNPVPSPPAPTDGIICIGSSATLSASGAISGQIYKWYDAASGGTLLKTSSNNTDNTYITTTLTTTTNYWVAMQNSTTGCESLRTQVTATYPSVSGDDQNRAGTNTWIGHVYKRLDALAQPPNDANAFGKYYGISTKAEQFDENFTGDATCFAVVASESPRSLYTEYYAVRYRMNSTTRKGIYVVDMGSDDGIRLTVDGTKVFDHWVQRGYNVDRNVLFQLTRNSNLLFEFFESAGGNRVSFQGLTRLIENKLTGNTSQSACIGDAGTAISGDVYGTLPTGITLSGTGYQWAYSTTLGGSWINIPGATAATYTPNTASAPFNAANTYYIIRNAILSSTNNFAPNPYVATNESNVATFIVNPLPLTGEIIPD